jgi:cell division septation protein DedD
MAGDESRGVHLSDKQLVFAFMAAAVVAVVVFLLGVFVGRGVRQATGSIADGGTAAASEVVPDGPAAEPPAADGATRPAGGGAGGDDLTYPERLGKTPPADQAKAAPPPVGDRPGDSAPPEVPAEPVAVPPAAAAPLSAPVTGPPAAAVTPSAAAPYTVQVAAVKRRDEADAIVKRLKAKGYDAYVFVPEGGDNLGVFRVRVGSFKDKRQADLLAERLLREEKRYKPWVTR